MPSGKFSEPEFINLMSTIRVLKDACIIEKNMAFDTDDMAVQEIQVQELPIFVINEINGNFFLSEGNLNFQLFFKVVVE